MKTDIVLIVRCVNCGKEIGKPMALFHSEDKAPAVSLDNFVQGTWHCPECDHDTCTGDFDDIYDSEDL